MSRLSNFASMSIRCGLRSARAWRANRSHPGRRQAIHDQGASRCQDAGWRHAAGGVDCGACDRGLPYRMLRRDHELATRLAQGLAAVDPSCVDLDTVQTNIVNCFVDRFADDAIAINDALRERGVLANSRRTKLRFVTHYQVDQASVDVAIGQFAQVIS